MAFIVYGSRYGKVVHGNMACNPSARAVSGRGVIACVLDRAIIR